MLDDPRTPRRRAAARLAGGVAVGALLWALALAAPAGALGAPSGQAAAPTGTPAPAGAETAAPSTDRGSVTGASPASPVPAQPRFTG